MIKFSCAALVCLVVALGCLLAPTATAAPDPLADTGLKFSYELQRKQAGGRDFRFKITITHVDRRANGKPFMFGMVTQAIIGDHSPNVRFGKPTTMIYTQEFKPLKLGKSLRFWFDFRMKAGIPYESNTVFQIDLFNWRWKPDRTYTDYAGGRLYLRLP